MMHRYGSLLPIVAALSLALAGAACDGSSPLEPTNGSENSSGDDSGLSQLTGRVESASRSSDDPAEGTIVLEGDIQVRVTSETRIDGDGDLTSLEEALAAIQDGTPVRIEIEGTLDDGVFTATRIRFETDDSSSGSGDNDDDENEDDDDDEDDLDEVHGVVASVDLGTRIVTLADGRVLRVANDDLIESDGDFVTLAQVQAAIAGGLEVRVEADGQIVNGAFEVTSVEFEFDEADDPGDDDDDDGDDDDNDEDDDDDDEDDDDDPDEIHGIVAQVDLGARTVTLADGRLLRVANDALIEVDGDFLTLAGVLAAIEAGLEVRLEADGGIVDGVFEVTSVEFESDEADGPGDDDDDDEDDDNSGPGNGGDDEDDDEDDEDDDEGDDEGDEDDDEGDEDEDDDDDEDDDEDDD